MFEKVSRSLKYDSNIFFDHRHIAIYIYSASNLQGPLFQFFTNAFVFFCRMGTVGDVKLKVCIHVDKSFLIVCV